jgi:hypothetical protein
MAEGSSTNLEEHERQTFVSVFLILSMMVTTLNVGHYLKHKNFTFLSESAIFILFGIWLAY